MKTRNFKFIKMKKLFVVWTLIVFLGIFGECRCIYKAITCNWEPVGKAEIVYTVSAATGIGAIVGWFNIKDY